MVKAFEEQVWILVSQGKDQGPRQTKY